MKNICFSVVPAYLFASAPGLARFVSFSFRQLFADPMHPPCCQLVGLFSFAPLVESLEVAFSFSQGVGCLPRPLGQILRLRPSSPRGRYLPLPSSSSSSVSSSSAPSSALLSPAISSSLTCTHKEVASWLACVSR